MGRLGGRTVLITGTTGIGAATAQVAAREGAAVFVVSQTADHARALAADVGGGWAQADLAEEDQVDAAVSAAIEHLGRIDGCVTVAGGSARRFGDGPIHAIDAAAWEATERLNLRTQVLTLARVVRAMREQSIGDGGSRGSLVLVGSALATSPVPELFGTHGYAATKAALTGLMTTMAATYVHERIRVNLVAPSLTRTPMASRAAGDAHVLEFAARKQPLAGQMLDPVEVANAALFFLSDESRTITGQSLAVDGGWSLVSTTAEAPSA